MKVAEFVDFLLAANTAGYANPDTAVEELPDGSHRVVYTKGSLTFTDTWFGGNPFSGQESVADDAKTIWAMQYRGRVGKGFECKSTKVFQVLKIMLGECTAEEPLRGPREKKWGEWFYTNQWSRNLEEFSGVEELRQKGELAHICHYMGGLVNGVTFEKEDV